MIVLWIGTVLAGIFIASVFIKLYLDKLYSYEALALEASLREYRLAYTRSEDRYEELKRKYKLLRSEQMKDKT